MANTNKVLNKAGVAKKDEFYTQLTDIEKEMRYYREYLRTRPFCVIVTILLKATSSNICHEL